MNANRVMVRSPEGYIEHASEQRAFTTFRIKHPLCVAMPCKPTNNKIASMSAVYATPEDGTNWRRSMPVGFIVVER
jgi:hypothetical protein